MITGKILVVLWDTSVIGGYLDKEFQEWSRQLFDEFKTGIKTAVISDITLDELENARKEVRDLFETYSRRK